MSQTSVATGPPVLSFAVACSSYCHGQWLNLNPTRKRFMGSDKFEHGTPNLVSAASTTRLKVSSSLLRASNSPPEEEVERSNVSESYGVSQDDVSYLWKLGLGSVAGAAIIKYGSILFPYVTRPNLPLALLMILTPVIVSVILLIKQSD
ncbi:hypothetical protein K2173_019081 [Erythroxylum novogranatense]|uniref:Uncharacterized protein n=1 Tax=Erythroxylum novogranatense TaxID=1862640 RepID=A0AAV8STK7_9ROSI|nr:hypothetical protein K2173_019081 [Erythroxylum novogranatense]